MLSQRELVRLSTIKGFGFQLWARKSIFTLSNHELGLFLAGLIEGDGSFGKSGLEVAFDSQDVVLAEAIALRLDLDPVLYVSWRKPKEPGHEGSWRLHVYKDTQAFGVVLNLINGCFVGSEKLKQIKAHGLNLKLEPSEDKPGLTFLPASSANAVGFWISGFFSADGSVFISEKNKVLIDFNQRNPFLLNLIATHFDLTVYKGWRKKTQRFEYYVRAASFQKLADLFAHFDLYPCMGIKHGQLFFARQAQLFKMRVYRRHESQDRYAYLQTCRKIMHRLNCKCNDRVYHFEKPDLYGKVWDPSEVVYTRGSFARKLFLLSRLEWRKALRLVPNDMVLWPVDAPVASAKQSPGGTRLAVWHSEEEVYGFFASLSQADKWTNQNRLVLTCRLKDPNDPLVRLWEELSADEKAQALNASKATDATAAASSTRPLQMAVLVEGGVYRYCSSQRKAAIVLGQCRETVRHRLRDPADFGVMLWSDLSSDDRARALNAPPEVKPSPKGRKVLPVAEKAQALDAPSS